MDTLILLLKIARVLILFSIVITVVTITCSFCLWIIERLPQMLDDWYDKRRRKHEREL